MTATTIPTWASEADEHHDKELCLWCDIMLYGEVGSTKRVWGILLGDGCHIDFEPDAEKFYAAIDRALGQGKITTRDRDILSAWFMKVEAAAGGGLHG